MSLEKLPRDFFLILSCILGEKLSLLSLPFFCFKDRLHLIGFKWYMEFSIFILITFLTMFNAVTQHHEAIKYCTQRTQLLKTASNRECAVLQTAMFVSYSEGIFKAAVLRGTGSMICWDYLKDFLCFIFALFARQPSSNKFTWENHRVRTFN